MPPAARREYDAATKAAVMAALLAGQSVSAIAKEYAIPKGTVSNWKTRRDAVPSAGTQKDATIGELLIELVRANLRGLIAGALLLQDAQWLRTQGAAELGTLFGITNDKTVRMLEALGRADEPADAPEPAT